MKRATERATERAMRKRILVTLAAALLLAATAVAAQAETLSWNAVTTYTDGTSVGTATVTYQAYWSTNASLSGLAPLGSSTTSTSRAFSVDTEGMPRGSIVYLTCKATVGGVDSALASPLSWNVPSKAPAAPANLRLN